MLDSRSRTYKKPRPAPLTFMSSVLFTVWTALVHSFWWNTIYGLKKNKFDFKNYYVVDCCYRVMDFKYVNYMDTQQYSQSLERLQELYIHEDMQGIKTGFYSVSADLNFYKINIDRLEIMHQQEMKNKQKGKEQPTQELPF